LSKIIRPDSRLLLSHPAHFLALGFGAGLAPRAPGTFGTLAAIPLYILMSLYLNQPAYLALTIVLAILGIWVCGVTDKALGASDHGAIVWDEITGFLLTMFMAPLAWWSVLAGFLLFRFFDILKPFPISWFDKHVKGGVGTMLDDVLAGIYAWFCLQAGIFFLADLIH
jgi:phosphatidylglycerophosphatase A